MADSTTINTDKSSKSDQADGSALQIRGQKSDLNSSNGGKSNISHEYNADLDEHVVAPVSGAKAARRVDEHDHMLSDDECPKVLTTLETVKKPTILSSASEQKDQSIDHEEEEGTVLLEVCNDDNGITDDKSTSKPMDTKKQLAESQLGNMKSYSRGRPRKYSTIEVDSKQVQAKKLTTYRHSIDTANFRKERYQKTKVEPNTSSILIKKENPKDIPAKFAEPLSRLPAGVQVKKVSRILNKIDVPELRIPTKQISTQLKGTIEIPRELLLPETDIPPSPVILNHANTGKKLNNDELIAILEGEAEPESSSVEHFEVSIEGNGDLRTVQVNSQANTNLTKDEERKIAIEQIMNLPTKKKGRPRLDPAQKKTPIKLIKIESLSAKNKISPNMDLVSALVSDWEDNDIDLKNSDAETEIIVKIQNNAGPSKVAAPVQRKRKSIPAEIPQPSFKSSRIIKKKVIWDPDAPETAINYASFAHTSGPGPQKKIISKSSTEEKPAEKPVLTRDVGRESASPSSLKKKKISEIDRLLGDEGAKNMLNSLNQDNNNSEKSDNTKIKSARKIVKTEPYDSIIHNLPKAKTPRKEISPKAVPVRPAPVGSIKKDGSVAKKRGPKTDSSWDYVYSARAGDDSMIIRRRSNSSDSSIASTNRLSLDLSNTPSVNDNHHGDPVEPAKKKLRASKEKDSVFEFTKPIAKKSIKTDTEPNANQSSILSDIRGKLSKAISGESRKTARTNDSQASKIVKESIDSIATTDPDVALKNVLMTYSELTVKTHKHCVQLILSPLAAGNGGRYKNLFTIQVFFRNQMNFFLILILMQIIDHFIFYS